MDMMPVMTTSATSAAPIFATAFPAVALLLALLLLISPLGL